MKECWHKEAEERISFEILLQRLTHEYERTQPTKLIASKTNKQINT